MLDQIAEFITFLLTLFTNVLALLDQLGIQLPF